MARRKKRAALVAPDSAPMILERSLLAGIASLVPVPIVDDYLLKRSRTALLKDVARRAQMEIAEDAVDELAGAPAASKMASAGLSVVARVLRGAALPLRVIDRARSALVTFQRATLLDHYARHHHEGGVFTLEQAKQLRARMDLALADVPLSSWRVPQDHGNALRAAFDSQQLLEPAR